MPEWREMEQAMTQVSRQVLGRGIGSNTSVEVLNGMFQAVSFLTCARSNVPIFLARLLSAAEFLGAAKAPCLVRKYFTTENSVRDFSWIQNLSLHQYMLKSYLGLL